MVANIFFGSKEEKRDDLLEVVNKFTEQVVSKYPKCSIQDAQKALLIAEKSFQNTKNSPLHQRINWLLDVAKTLKAQKNDIAKTITDEVGKPIAFSKIEVDRAVETIELSAYAIANLHGETIDSQIMPSGKKTIGYFKRVPAGVAICITPFNFPLNLAVHKLAPALGCGNSVILKPTPEAPLTAYKLVKIFIESPYATKDAISLVYGDADVGGTLVSSEIPRVISFTGSVQVGQIITKTAGIKKVSLELGGNAATFIDKSADLKFAAARCAYGAFVNSGQVCISLQRIYVHSEIYDEFATLLAKEVKTLKVGNPYEEATFMGPLINAQSVERASNWVRSALNEGAKVICGGFSDRNIFYPTILTNVTDDMQIICEEVFAPIVSLVKVENYDEAIAKINNSPYGLQFSIFTNNLGNSQKFIDEANCGGVVVNDIPTLRFDVQPYGGVKYSGIGKEGPRFAVEEFTEIKSVFICS